MKHKKSLLIICLIICLFSIASVCASDVNETIIASEDQSDELITLDDIGATEDEALSESPGTFTELDAKIKNGTEIVLDKDYQFDSDIDLDYQDGVEISKTITIDGNGFNIKSNNNSYIFKITNAHVTLKNFVFKNNDVLNKIYWISGNATIINCSFENSELSIIFKGDNLFVVNSTFKDCIFHDAHAIDFEGINLLVKNSLFSNCSGKNGVAIYAHSSKEKYYTIINSRFTYNHVLGESIVSIYCYKEGIVNIINSTFTNNQAKSTGAISINSENANLINCSFTNNSAIADMGSVYLCGRYNIGGNFSCINCSFINNSAQYGSAIWIYNTNGVIVNCSFYHNNASKMGTLYLQNGIYNTINCNFTNNLGRAPVSWQGKGGIISNCSFINEIEPIYWYASNSSIVNCIFKNNTSPEPNYYISGSLIDCGSINNSMVNCSFVNCSPSTNIISFSNKDCNVISSKFVNNSVTQGVISVFDGTLIKNCLFDNNVGVNGGAIYITNKNATLENSIFNNNFANNGGAIYIKCSRYDVQLNLNNCSFNTNKAKNGGVVYITSTNSINFKFNAENCNFTNNSAEYRSLFSENNVISTHIINNSLFTNHYPHIKFENETRIDNNFSIDSDVDGIIEIFVDNIKLNTTNISEGKATIKIPKNISVGIHQFTIKFLDNGLYNQSIVNKEVFVDKSLEFDVELNNTVWGEDLIFNMNNDATGVINITFDETLFFDNLRVNESVVISSRILTAGMHKVIIQYSGDSIYSNKTFLITFYIEKSIINMNVSILSNGVNENVTFNIELPKYTTGNITVEIGNEKYFSEVTSQLIKIVTKKMPKGNYTAVIRYSGDENHFNKVIREKFSIEKIKPTIHIIANNTSVGYETNLITLVFGSNNLTINEGTVTFFDGKTYIGQSDVENSIASLIYTPTYDGEHNITAIFNSNNHLSSNNTVKLLVDSASIEVIANTGMVGFNTTFVANVKGLYSIINEGTVAFYINDNFIGKSNVVNGIANLVYTPLSVGNFMVKAVYDGGNKFLKAESSTNYIVSQANTQIVIDDVTGTVYHELMLTSRISSSNNLTINEGTITFSDNDDVIGIVMVNNGVASLSYIPYSAGEHVISAVYVGNNYISSNTSSTIHIDKENTQITSSDVSTVYNGNKYLTLTLKDINGNALSGSSVLVNLNGVKTFNTDQNGQIKVSTNNLAPKKYTATLTFNGDSNYNGATKSVKVIVKKATPKMTASAKTFKVKDKTKKYTVTLKTNRNVAMKNTKITLKVNGKTYAAKTNAKGVATFKLTKLAKKGKYTAVVKYAGNAYYNAKTVKPKLTVK